MAESAKLRQKLRWGDWRGITEALGFLFGIWPGIEAKTWPSEYFMCQSDTSPLKKVCQPQKSCVRNGHLRKKTLIGIWHHWFFFSRNFFITLIKSSIFFYHLIKYKISALICLQHASKSSELFYQGDKKFKFFLSSWNFFCQNDKKKISVWHAPLIWIDWLASENFWGIVLYVKRSHFQGRKPPDIFSSTILSWGYWRYQVVCVLGNEIVLHTEQGVWINTSF